MCLHVLLDKSSKTHACDALCHGGGTNLCGSVGISESIDSISVSMINGASPDRTAALFRNAYDPVSKEYLEGVQVAAELCASVKLTPSFARRSIFGVRYYNLKY